MKTCATCKFWQSIGQRSMPGRIVLDHRVLTVPTGPEGHCRCGPPIEDNRWPLTSGGDWCGAHSGLREAVRIEGAGTPSEPRDALAALDAQLEREKNTLSAAEANTPGAGPLTAATGQPAAESTPGGGESEAAASAGAALEEAAAIKVEDAHKSESVPVSDKPRRAAEKRPAR